MLLLTSTSDKIQIITGTAVTVDVHASFVDYDGTTVTPGRTNSKITTATTTDVVASPGASVQRNVKTLHICNIHASSSVLVTVQHTDGTNVIKLEEMSLLAGERLSYVEGQGFELVDANGITKTNSTAAVFVNRLASDLANTTTTAAKVTGLDTPCGVGTWIFEYYVYYTTVITTTGIKLGVNHTGTVTTFMYWLNTLTALATAADGLGDQDIVTTTGGVMQGWAARAKSTNAPLITAGVDTNAADMMAVIQGIAIVSVAGNIELYSASEVGTSSTSIKGGTSLRLTRTA